MDQVFAYFWVLAVLQFAAAALVIAAGAAFLRLRAWARTTLEVFSWLALVYDLGFGVFWLWSLTSFMRPPAGQGTAAELMPVVMMVFGAVMILAFAIPPVVVIKVLRGRTVRGAIAAAN